MRGTAATATAPAVCVPLATRPVGMVVWGCASCLAGALPKETTLTGVSNESVTGWPRFIWIQRPTQVRARRLDREAVTLGAPDEPAGPAGPAHREVDRQGRAARDLADRQHVAALDLHGEVRAVGGAHLDARDLSGEGGTDDVRERVAGRAEARARPFEPRRHGQAAHGDHGHRRADPDTSSHRLPHLPETLRRRAASTYFLASFRESGRSSCCRLGANAGRVSGNPLSAGDSAPPRRAHPRGRT